MLIESINKWFEVAVPNPTDKNRAVQIGCHFEEVAEMIDAIGDMRHVNINVLADTYKCIAYTQLDEVHRNALLDSLADQIVTAIGVAHMFNLDIAGALQEVNRSNYSKFVDGLPVFDANGKISKPVTYSPPDLSKFV